MQVKTNFPESNTKWVVVVVVVVCLWGRITCRGGNFWAQSEFEILESLFFGEAGPVEDNARRLNESHLRTE